MSIIQADGISKSFQGRQVLSDLSFAIDATDKIGLIGRNGSGKSTLLKLLTGNLEPDQGRIHRAGSTAMSMLDQRPLADDHQNISILDNPRFLRIETRMRHIEDQMAAAKGPALDLLIEEFSRLQQRLEDEGAYDYRARLARNLAGLGLTEKQMNQPRDTLSGGEQMRVALGRLLLEPGELLLLDEPTNHLDFDGLDWLQQYLLSRQSALVVVSHDRWFLDQVCGRIFELENKRLYIYKGNYSQAMEQKRQERELLDATLNRLTGEIRRQEDVTQTMLSHRKMKSYHSREKVVEKLKDQLAHLQDQVNPDRRMTFNFLPADTKKDRNRLLISAEDLSMAFDRTLFDRVSFELAASDRIALVGPNGCGKTTLLRILLGRQEADSGRLLLYGDPSMASMGQVVDFNHEDQTVFQYLASSFPSTETRIRDRLARFGFREEAMIKQLKALSGGERHRLHLCSLLEQKPDLLVLDEPTNHLDIESRHLLEQALADFHGAVIVVSHDRYFIRTVARSILGFVGHEVHPFTDYQDWYLEHRRLEDQQAGQIAVKAGESPRVAVRRIRARQRQAVTDITQRIKTLEEACRLFEQKAPDKLQDDDYQLYALQLVELEELYQAYIELDEAMADEA